MNHIRFGVDPIHRETAEERQHATYLAARPLSDAIEAFADWLGSIWDFDADEVSDHDIDVMRRVLAWFETMPAEMRDAFLAHVKRERAEFRRRNPAADLRPLTVLGVALPGVVA